MMHMINHRCLYPAGSLVVSPGFEVGPGVEDDEVDSEISRYRKMSL